MATPKRPRDPIQLAKLIGDIATQQTVELDPDAGKSQAAIELGRKGGLKGGKARAESLSKKQLSAAGRKAAMARWGRKPK